MASADSYEEIADVFQERVRRIVWCTLSTTDTQGRPFSRAEWCDDKATRQRIWNLLAGAPPPVGYDPGLFFRGGVDDPGYGVLRLEPTRWTARTNGAPR